MTFTNEELDILKAGLRELSLTIGSGNDTDFSMQDGLIAPYMQNNLPIDQVMVFELAKKIFPSESKDGTLFSDYWGNW